MLSEVVPTQVTALPVKPATGIKMHWPSVFLNGPSPVSKSTDARTVLGRVVTAATLVAVSIPADSVDGLSAPHATRRAATLNEVSLMRLIAFRSSAERKIG